MQKLSNKDDFMANKYLEKINELKDESLGVSIRKLIMNNIEVHILYISQLTDRERLSNDIIKPLLIFEKDDVIDTEKVINSIIYIDDILTDNEGNKITEYILEGKSVIILSNDDNYIII